MASETENPVYTFEGVLKPVENTSAMMIDFPFDVQECFGTKGQVKMLATYDGIPYRGSLAKMGHACHFLVVRTDILKQLGKKAGDTVYVSVQKDLEERIVELPPELAALFEVNPEAKGVYDRLSYTHRKEYVQWINEAKRPETRQNRLLKTIEMLLNKKKHPQDK